MKKQEQRRYVIVTRKSRAKSLRSRYASASLAKYALEEAGENYGCYEKEEDRLEGAVSQIVEATRELGPTLVVERNVLPGTPFVPSDVVIAVGQDGLVVNTLRYTQTIPIFGVNPDPEAYEGTLLHFSVKSLLNYLAKPPEKERAQPVTLASCQLSTGAVLLAANDIFIGKSNQTSALYRLSHEGKEEAHSSSGVIVSTPLGASGWQRSIIDGAAQLVGELTGKRGTIKQKTPPLDEPRLRFWVREPWRSVKTGCSLVAGKVTSSTPLQIVSEMGEGGVIFSDGICEDFFDFPAGTTATLTPANHKGKIILDKESPASKGNRP
jgi:NAD kinase